MDPLETHDTGLSDLRPPDKSRLAAVETRILSSVPFWVWMLPSRIRLMANLPEDCAVKAALRRLRKRPGIQVESRRCCDGTARWEYRLMTCDADPQLDIFAGVR